MIWNNLGEWIETKGRISSAAIVQLLNDHAFSLAYINA